MAREKFQTLTEQMFYILLCLRVECCGADIMAKVSEMTGGRVQVGPGTRYNLLESFLAERWILETRTQGRRRYYCLTRTGKETLDNEYRRLETLAADYRRALGGPGEEASTWPM